MKTLLIFSLFFLFTVSCQREEEKCSGSQVCTYIFKMVNVEVRNENGERVILDSALVKNLTNGAIEAPEHLHHPDFYSYYVIADDSDRESISFQGTPFQFKGWIGVELVVDEEFLIGKDCCHIEKLEGPDEIIVN